MLFHTVENGNGLSSSITPSSGAVSVNTTKMKGMVRLIHINPTTSTTEWSLNIIDKGSRTVRKYVSEVGLRNDTEPLPVDGIYTLQFTGVTADEAITVCLKVEEANR
jgi:hypothetical protein